MSITDTVKGVVFGKKKQQAQQPTQVIEHQHHWVQPPPQPKTFSQKIESLRKSTDKFAKKSFATPQKESSGSMVVADDKKPSMITRAKGMVDTISKGRGVSTAVTKAKESIASSPQAREGKRFGEFIAPPTKKQVTAMKATAQSRRTQVAPILSLMGGNADTYHKPTKTIKMGRRISKKEAKRLKTLYGENWAQKLQKNSKGYYTQPTPADMAQARKERKLTSNAVDFGVGFESMRTGMEVSLTRDMGNVTGDRESEDPFNIDARFGGASAGLGVATTKRKAKNGYDINANFNTGGFRL